MICFKYNSCCLFPSVSVITVLVVKDLAGKIGAVFLLSVALQIYRMEELERILLMRQHLSIAKLGRYVNLQLV